MREAVTRTLAVFAVWLTLTALAPRGASAEITMGILPRLDPVLLYDMFTPLAEHLSKATGERVRLVIPRSFDDFKAMVSSNLVDLGFSNPLIYVQVRRDGSIEPLAV